MYPSRVETGGICLIRRRHLSVVYRDDIHLFATYGEKYYLLTLYEDCIGPSRLKTICNCLVRSQESVFILRVRRRYLLASYRAHMLSSSYVRRRYLLASYGADMSSSLLVWRLYLSASYGDYIYPPRMETVYLSFSYEDYIHID